MLFITGLTFHEGVKANGTGTERTRNGYIQRETCCQIEKAERRCGAFNRSGSREDQQEWSRDEAEHVSTLGDSTNITAVGCTSCDCESSKGEGEGVDTAEIIFQEILQNVRLCVYRTLTMCKMELSRLSASSTNHAPSVAAQT